MIVINNLDSYLSAEFIGMFMLYYSVSKITIASLSDQLSSDKSLIPGVPLVAKAISTEKCFMQYRKCVTVCYDNILKH